LDAARRIGAVSLVVAPLFGLVGGALHPERESDAAALYAVVAANLDRWYAAHVLFFVGSLLLLPGVLLLWDLARARSPRLALAGVVLGVIGLVGAAGVAAVELAVWEAAQPTVAPDEAVRLIERLSEGAAVTVPVYGASLCFPLGFALLGAALWLAGAAPRWAAACIGLGPVAFSVGGLGGSLPLTVAGSLLSAAGLGWVGLAQLGALPRPSSRSAAAR
jgi:hypothetical protein